MKYYFSMVFSCAAIVITGAIAGVLLSDINRRQQREYRR